MDIESIIRYERPESTYYDILGCDRSASVEQIVREYRIKALHLHPDKNPSLEAGENFRILQQAKDVLTDPTVRRSYDKWLDSRIHIPFEDWHQGKKGHSMHWAPPRPTKLSLGDSQGVKAQDDGLDLRRGQTDFIPVGANMGKPLKSQPNLLEKFRNYEI